jgi:hypothetical protein
MRLGVGSHVRHVRASVSSKCTSALDALGRIDFRATLEFFSVLIDQYTELMGSNLGELKVGTVQHGTGLILRVLPNALLLSLSRPSNFQFIATDAFRLHDLGLEVTFMLLRAMMQTRTSRLNAESPSMQDAAPVSVTPHKSTSSSPAITATAAAAEAAAATPTVVEAAAAVAAAAAARGRADLARLEARLVALESYRALGYSNPFLSAPVAAADFQQQAGWAHAPKVTAAPLSRTASADSEPGGTPLQLHLTRAEHSALLTAFHTELGELMSACMLWADGRS